MFSKQSLKVSILIIISSIFLSSCCYLLYKKEDCNCSTHSKEYIIKLNEGDFFGKKLPNEVFDKIHKTILDGEEFPKYVEIQYQDWYYSFIIKGPVRMDGVMSRSKINMLKDPNE